MPSGPPPLIWTTRDWARALAALPAEGPLPCRTALVPREPVAHALRRELIEAGLGHALAGTRFVTALGAALEVLAGAGGTPEPRGAGPPARVEPGEEGLRRTRLLALFEGAPGDADGLRLTHFPLDLLRSRPGWDEAFAASIRDLEGAGLRPGELAANPPQTGRGEDAARLSDVAAIWRRLDEEAAASWTAPRIFAEASRHLGERPGLWPWPGPVLAAVDGHESRALAGFLRAIPGVTLALRPARPAREHHVSRMAALYGEAAAGAARGAAAPRASRSERDLLASYLFEPPPLLADRARPRSPGPDGTVELEEHAGVEEELDATADWVARQVLDGIALGDIAVLVPALDPLASLVGDRLARLPWAGGPLPVHVAGGVPLAATAAGARLLAVVRALRAHLGAEPLAAVLPALRPEPADRPHLSHGAARDLVWSLGTAGGHPGHPGGALEWAERAGQREAELAAELQAARQAEDDPERSGVARRARDLERLLDDLSAMRPALAALVELARLALGRATISRLWEALRDFAGRWLLEPGGGPRAETLVEPHLAGPAADAAGGRLAGHEALRLIEDAVAATRLPAGRFGEPAVYLGTVQDAVGLAFEVVRVVALAEGHLPPLPREDPVLPDEVRAGLAGPAGTAALLRTAADRTLAPLHALDQVIRGARRRVALSFPRRDLQGSDREPAAVLLEAAAALGRPHALAGRAAPAIPDLASLRRDGFRPARSTWRAFRRRTPLGEGAWHDGVAAGDLGLPPAWMDGGARDLELTLALLTPSTPGPLDGLVADAAIAVPGLGTRWPVSPSRLETLLRCPHQFLLAHLLGFEEPPAAPSPRRIEQPAWGALVHRVAEAFYREHGPRFCARLGTLADWQRLADPVVEGEFEAFLRAYPLVGGTVRNAERERLRHDVHALLEYDWERGAGRRFVAVERAFGEPDPVALPAGDGVLFLRGRIDRLDVDGNRTLVRDFKTGRPWPRRGRQAAPDPARDVQLALYGLVAERLAPAWGLPARVAAAYAYVGPGADERAFRHDFDDVLAPAAREWLQVAAGLLTGRLFPRTPDPGDCRWCPFRPVCGSEVHDRARRLLLAAEGPLARFAALRRPVAPGGPEAEAQEDEA